MRLALGIGGHGAHSPAKAGVNALLLRAFAHPTGALPMMSAFEPPLQLAGTPAVFIRSLDDAALFLRGYDGRWPATRNLILRRLDTASSEQEMGEAAKSFRWWAQMEGLLARLE